MSLCNGPFFKGSSAPELNGAAGDGGIANSYWSDASLLSSEAVWPPPA